MIKILALIFDSALLFLLASAVSTAAADKPMYRSLTDGALASLLFVLGVFVIHWAAHFFGLDDTHLRSLVWKGGVVIILIVAFVVGR
jgi:uncharacterized MAPEG superfamily protein